MLYKSGEIEDARYNLSMRGTNYMHSAENRERDERTDERTDERAVGKLRGAI